MTSIHIWYFYIQIKYVVDFCILPEGIPINRRGAIMVRFELSYLRGILLFCSSSRVHNRGANAIVRYDIYVKTVLLILFEGFTNILTFVGFAPSRSQCLAVY